MKRLELIFENEQGKNVTISVDEPVEPLEPNVVHAAMDEIINQNAFTSSGGDLVRKSSARIVERNVTVVDLGIE